MAPAGLEDHIALAPAAARAEGQAAALRSVKEGEAAILLALMALDTDRHGALTLVALRQAMLRLDQVT